MTKATCIGTIGDINPLNDGGIVLDHGDGRLTVEYLCEVDDGEEGRFYELYRCALDDIGDAVNGPGNQWVNVKGVAECCDIAVEELKRLAAGAPMEKAMALWTVAGYYGWQNFDSYPVRMSEEEAEEWADGLPVAREGGE